MEKGYNIIVTGKSGAGKQPRIDVIAKELGLTQLSTGTMFRECITAYERGEKTEDADRGKIVVDCLSKGEFAPDDVTNQMFEKHFKRHNYENCILDGYPRTLGQAEFLMKLLKDNESHIDMIIEVHREDENIIYHLTGRRTCRDCKQVYHIKDNPPKEENKCECGGEVYQREDDTEPSIRSRLEAFHANVAPTIEELKRNIPYAKVDGFLNPYSKEEVKKTVLEALEVIMIEEPEVINS